MCTQSLWKLSESMHAGSSLYLTGLLVTGSAANSLYFKLKIILLKIKGRELRVPAAQPA